MFNLIKQKVSMRQLVFHVEWEYILIDLAEKWWINLDFFEFGWIYWCPIIKWYSRVVDEPNKAADNINEHALWPRPRTPPMAITTLFPCDVISPTCCDRFLDLECFLQTNLVSRDLHPDIGQSILAVRVKIEPNHKTQNLKI